MRAVAAGFIDPVRDSQSTFRAVLAAFAEPAIVRAISVDVPDIGIAPAALAILLALADIETPCWMPSEMGPEPRDYLRFHTGVRYVDEPSQASLALVPSVMTLPHLGEFGLGTAIAPETSTTVIVIVDDFVSGTAVLLDGPGFDSPRELAPSGFDDERWDDLAANHRQFPAGVDLLLVSGVSVVGLPRSTRIAARTRTTVAVA